MKRFFDRARAALDDLGSDTKHNHAQVSQQPLGDATLPTGVVAPTLVDVARYRYHHGTNLGSVFVQERWLTGSFFPPDAAGSSELAAAQAWLEREGLESARRRFEQHWEGYVSDADLDWLRDVGRATTVRLPIGFYSLGPALCSGTAFEPIADIYANSWSAVQRLVDRCWQRGIAVLLDLHALPGGANAQEHSGTNSGKAELWGSRKNRQMARKCVQAVFDRVKGLQGIAGVQIVNEAEHGSKDLYDWYDDVLKDVSKIDPTIPVYISDGWDLSQAATQSQRWNASGRTGICPVVVDTHLYWCFSPEDGQKPPQQIIDEVSSKLNEGDMHDGSVIDRGASQVIVGEYSCVLGEDSWTRSGDESKESLVQKFGRAQSQRYQARAGGSFFWTYRMDWMPGGEWGFKHMTEQSALSAPFPASPVSEPQALISHLYQTQREPRLQHACASHAQYWDTAHPGYYEHWRFEQGWTLGWDDAAAFFGLRSSHGAAAAGGDRIGLLELWILKRLREGAAVSTQHGGGGDQGHFWWEWEQGFRQGVKAFEDSCRDAVGSN